MAFRAIVTAATIVCLTIPVRAQAQNSAKTACNDGTATTASGSHACDGHGGIHHVHSTILHRAPSGAQQGGTVSQAGTPNSRDTQAQPEEHRGWRWSHPSNDHDDRRRAEEKRREEENRRAEEKRRDDERHRAEERRRAEDRQHRLARVRCRDGKYEDVKEHGKGKGPDVCKHHGGVAH